MLKNGKVRFLIAGLLLLVVLLFFSFFAMPDHENFLEQNSNSPFYIAAHHPFLKSLGGAAITSAVVGYLPQFNATSSEEMGNQS